MTAKIKTVTKFNCFFKKIWLSKEYIFSSFHFFFFFTENKDNSYSPICYNHYQQSPLVRTKIHKVRLQDYHFYHSEITTILTIVRLPLWVYHREITILTNSGLSFSPLREYNSYYFESTCLTIARLQFLPLRNYYFYGWDNVIHIVR